MPPAPACRVTIESIASYLPVSSVCRRSSSRSSVSLSSSAESSALVSSSPSSSTSAMSASASSTRFFSLAKPSILPSMPESSRLTVCACLMSFQKPSSFCFSSSSLFLACNAGKSSAPSISSSSFFAPEYFSFSSSIITIFCSPPPHGREPAYFYSTYFNSISSWTPYFPQQFLYFLPLPQGQGSLRPTFLPSRFTVEELFS